MKVLILQKKLTRQDKLLLALMKLRQGLQFQILAGLFYISRLLASKTFKNTLDILARELNNLIVFPTREKLNIPLSFQSQYATIYL